ncbi:hypothetical protein LAZ67_21000937 [Cordylochernes scorpioides]|uniref:Uncharacterized protein n=1 Tax=Cordylochernes scorpioides TaxID=51811 RepID=A0ABY6LNZ9_9ARAC|nr:hypothetical protein LAZ67_21000937 [Cordylochernes scorpioides]
MKSLRVLAILFSLVLVANALNAEVEDFLSDEQEASVWAGIGKFFGSLLGNAAVETVKTGIPKTIDATRFKQVRNKFNNMIKKAKRNSLKIFNEENESNDPFGNAYKIFKKLKSSNKQKGLPIIDNNQESEKEKRITDIINVLIADDRIDQDNQQQELYQEFIKLKNEADMVENCTDIDKVVNKLTDNIIEAAYISLKVKSNNYAYDAGANTICLQETKLKPNHLFKTPGNERVIRRSRRLQGLQPELSTVHPFPARKKREREENRPFFHRWRDPTVFSGECGKHSQLWLCDFQRVTRYHKWDYSMCLSNVIFYLTGTAKCWFENFEDISNRWENKVGREETADNERSGRSSTSTTPEKVDKVLELVRKDRRTTVREVAEEAGISFGSIHSIMKDILGVRRLNAVLVPKDLTFDQKNSRKETASLNLEATTDDPELLKRVNTGDETRIYYKHYDFECR